MKIARPPILFYGLYGNAGDDSDRRLLQIIINRGLLADQLDCLAACGGCDVVRCGGAAGGGSPWTRGTAGICGAGEPV